MTKISANETYKVCKEINRILEKSKLPICVEVALLETIKLDLLLNQGIVVLSGNSGNVKENFNSKAYRSRLEKLFSG